MLAGASLWSSWISNRRHQGQSRLTGIEARVLHDHRHVRFNDACIISSVWNGLGIRQLIEPHVPGAHGAYLEGIGARGIPVAEENCHLDMGILAPAIED